MATYRTSNAGGGTSGTGNRTATIAAQAGDLLIVGVKWSGNSNASPTCTDDQSGTYTRILTALNNASADIMALFVRNQVVASTGTITVAPVVGSGTNTAGEIVTVAVSGMWKFGAEAILQSGSQANQTSGVPTPVLGAAAKAWNMTMMWAGSTTTAGSVPNASWTERQDVNQTSPVTCLEVSTRDSGFTGTSAAYVSIASAVWCSAIIELDTRISPAFGDDMVTLFDNDDSASVLEKNRASFSDDMAMLFDSDDVVMPQFRLRVPAFGEDQSINLIDSLTTILSSQWDRAVALLRDRGDFSESFGPLESFGAILRGLAPISDNMATLFDNDDAVSALNRFRALLGDDMTTLFDNDDSLAGQFRFRATLPEDMAALFDNDDSVSALFRLRITAMFDDLSGIYGDNVALAKVLIYGVLSDAIPLTDQGTAILKQLAVMNDDFSSTLADLVIASLLDVAGATPINAAFGDDVSLGLSDQATAILRLLGLASELLTYSDLLAAMQRHLAQTGDDAGVGMNDTVTALMRFLASASESFAPSDNPIALLRFLAVMSDALSMADLASAVGVARASMSDDASVGQNDLVAALMRYLASASDFMSVLDDAAAIERFIASFSDSISYNDLVNQIAPILSPISDLLGLNDLVSALMTMRGSFADDQGPNLSDIVNALMRQRLSISESYSPDDSVSALARFLANLSDATTLSDLISAALAMQGQMSDAASSGMTDLATALQVYLASIADQFAPSDSATMTAPLYGSFSEAFSSVDSVDALERMLGSFADTLGLIDLAAALHVYRSSMTDDAGQNLNDLLAAALAILAPLSDAVSLADTANGLLRQLAAPADSFSPADSLAALEVFLAQISDSFGPSDLLSVLATYRSNLNDDISANLADLVRALMPSLSSFSESFSPSDQATAILRALASFSDAFVMSDSGTSIQRSLAAMSDDASLGLADIALARLIIRAILYDDLSSTLADLVLFSFGTFQLKFTIDEDLGSNFSDFTLALLRLRVPAFGDQVNYQDVVSAIQAYRAAITDSTSPSDSLSGINAMLGSPSDSTGFLDTVLGREVFRVLISEDVSSGLTDLVAMNLIISGASALQYSFGEDQGANYTDLIAGLMRDLARPGESFTYSDIITATQFFLADMGETAAGTDAVTALQAYLTVIFDNANFSDSLSGLSRDRAAITDDVSQQLIDFVVANLIISFANQLAYSFSEDQGSNYDDAFQALMTLRGALAEAPGYSDLVSALDVFLARMSENSNADDIVTALQSLHIGITDTTSPSDLLSAVGAILSNPSELVGLFDLLSAQVNDISAAFIIRVINTLVKMVPSKIYSVEPFGIPYETEVVGMDTTTRTVSLLPKQPDETEIKSLSPSRTIKEVKE